MALPIVKSLAKRYNVSVPVAQGIWNNIRTSDFREAVAEFETKLQERLQLDPAVQDIHARLLMTGMVTMTLPFLVRLLEHARENVSSDTELHILSEVVSELGYELEQLDSEDFPSVIQRMGNTHANAAEKGKGRPTVG